METDHAPISHDQMYEALERLFERHFDHRDSLMARRDDGPPDLLYVEGTSRALHGVQIESSYDACILDINGGVHVADGMETNYRWIALPLHPFRDGERAFNGILESTCAERGIGLLCVYPRGRGYAAKIMARPDARRGRFLDAFPELESRWDEMGVLEKPRAMTPGYRAMGYV